MTDADTQFVVLREILHRPPSTRTWEALCAHLAGWPEGDAKELALAYAESHLETWDDRLRQGFIGLWWPSFPKGKPRPEWRLVRALRLDEPYIYLRPKASAPPSPEATEHIRSFQLVPHSASVAMYEQFVEGLGLTSLRALHIENHQLGAAALRELLEKPWLRDLTRLDIAYNVLQEAGMQHLIECFADGGLTWIDIAANELTDVALDAMIRSPLFPNLMHVNLGFNDLSTAALERFFDALSPGQLQTLRVDGLSLQDGPLGPMVLSHPSLSGLTQLSASRCQLGDVGAKALASSSFLCEVQSLEIAHNNITQVGAEALGRSRFLQRLTSLDLSYNPIGAFGLQAISRSPQLQRMTQLQIKGVKF